MAVCGISKFYQHIIHLASVLNAALVVRFLNEKILLAWSLQQIFTDETIQILNKY